MKQTKSAASFRPNVLCHGRKRHVDPSPPAHANLLLLSASALAVAFGCGEPAQAAPKLEDLYSFASFRGTVPDALIADGAGNFFGTTEAGGFNNDGVVYELSPPVAGKRHWTETVLVSFSGNNGNYPIGGLTTDGAGNFYGTTYQGGANNDGLVFELSPTAEGKKHWTETVLLTFNGTNGSGPASGLVADGAGNFYGTTFAGGTDGDGVVFELSPPAQGQTAWTESVLFSLNGANGAGPLGNLLEDGAGNLYETTDEGGSDGDGVAFELSPPVAGETIWTQTVLESFNGTNGNQPNGGLIADGAGNLYGTTFEGGANNVGEVFELSPPAEGKKNWAETVLHSFDGTNGTNPDAGLIFDGTGNLYGTTYSGAKSNGLVFELIPPNGRNNSWTETVLQSFDGTNGYGPDSNLIMDGAGDFYGTTGAGGANNENDGVVFELKP